MSRTDELAATGRERGGNSGDAGGFVKWGDTYTWLEGRVTGSFMTRYGLAVTLEVSNLHSHGVTVQSKENGHLRTEPCSVGDVVAVSTSPAALAGKITEDDVGRSFHIAFEGWGESRNASTRYRVFRVVEMLERADEPADTDSYKTPRVEDGGLPF